MSYTGFEELMFGDGRFLALLLIILLVVAITVFKKWAGILTVPVVLFLGTQYLSQVQTDGDFVWFAVACFLLIVYTVWEAVRD